MKRLVSMLMVVALLMCVFPVLGEPTNSNQLSDPRVRKALTYAIDMQAIIDGLMQGKATEAITMAPPGDWRADDLTAYEYDPDKAIALLQEANWDSNRVLDVVYYYGDQMTVDLLTAIQAYWEMVGVKMEMRKLEGDLASQLWVPPSDPLNGPSAVDWDLAYAAVAALSMGDYYDRYQGGYSSNSYNPQDDKLDALIAATNATADVDEQIKAYHDLERYENEIQVNIPLYHQPVFIVQSNRLDRGDAPYGNEQYIYNWDIVNWDIEPDANGKKVLLTNGGPMEFFETPFFNPGFLMSQKVLFDRLIIADENLTPKYPGLASEFSLSEDGLTFEFTLRDGIKWHDGDDITTDDVIGSIELATKAVTNPVLLTTFKAIEGYEDYASGAAESMSGITVDGNKVTIKFANINPNVLLTFTQFAPLPMKYFKDVDPLLLQQADYWQSPVGSGPFKVKEVKMGEYATFERFEDYYGGQAKIEEIRMYPSGESDANLAKNAAAGQVDYAYTKSVEDVIALEQMDHLKVTTVDVRYTRLFYVNKFPQK
ncbi:MAG: peptide ABC transporter substrate-binding protein [Christensenellaceae bacterium]|nr:peptide ABC transporter substrate-binding protein [Christensenellaceae bacterium]